MGSDKIYDTSVNTSDAISQRLARARRLLDTLDCSCVIIGRDDTVTTCYRHGVIDLYEYLTHDPETLRDAIIADKVVGKGAAAIMALGGITALHTRIISRPAFDLLRPAGIHIAFDIMTAGIVNRTQTGPCPVEKLCAAAMTPADCLPLITAFIEKSQLTDK